MSSPLANSIKGNFLYYFAEMVHKTCRVQISGEENIDLALNSGKPLIGTSWHGMTMMVLASLRKYVDFGSLVTIFPDDYRGDTLEIFANKLGIYPTKINLDGDPTLGMSRKLISIIKEIKAGKYFLIHPDGPAGPAYVVKPGLTKIAQKTGALIVPIGGYCRNAYHWHRWDRYTWPLPFSRIQVHVGKPFSIDVNEQDLTQSNRDMEDILNRTYLQAAANYYEKSG